MKIISVFSLLVVATNADFKASPVCIAGTTCLGFGVTFTGVLAAQELNSQHNHKNGAASDAADPPDRAELNSQHNHKNGAASDATDPPDPLFGSANPESPYPDGKTPFFYPNDFQKYLTAKIDETDKSLSEIQGYTVLLDNVQYKATKDGVALTIEKGVVLYLASLVNFEGGLHVKPGGSIVKNGFTLNVNELRNTVQSTPNVLIKKSSQDSPISVSNEETAAQYIHYDNVVFTESMHLQTGPPPYKLDNVGLAIPTIVQLNTLVVHKDHQLVIEEGAQVITAHYQEQL